MSERELCRRAGYQLKTLVRWKKGHGRVDVTMLESFLQVFDCDLKITGGKRPVPVDPVRKP